MNFILKNTLLDGLQEDHGLMKKNPNLHGPIFEEFFITASQDRCDIMCGLHAYYK